MTEPSRFEGLVDELLGTAERLARFRATKLGPFKGYTSPDPVGDARRAIERELERRVDAAAIRAAQFLKTPTSRGA